jgi:hypothetical protein
LIDMIRTRGGVDPGQVVNALGQAFARRNGTQFCTPVVPLADGQNLLRTVELCRESNW